MNLFFASNVVTELADQESELLLNTREALLSLPGIFEVDDPHSADAILIQEINSFKDFRYIKKLQNDPLISKFANKTYTINMDDCATGLLRGIYTCLPKQRFNSEIHAAVPYMTIPNELIQESTNDSEPFFLAGWRGNVKSNRIRNKLVNLFHSNAEFQLETSESWLNHDWFEKKIYVELIQNSKFSLCPAGWAPASYRIYESMALRRCPVIIADDFVPPKCSSWKHFALLLPEKDLSALHTFLSFYEKDYNLLGERAYQVWQDFFSPPKINKYYASTLLSLIQNAPRNSNELEMKRWLSFGVYWNNKWTLSQRAINRLKRTINVT
jgi:hypothetical protein